MLLSRYYDRPISTHVDADATRTRDALVLVIVLIIARLLQDALTQRALPRRRIFVLWTSLLDRHSPGNLLGGSWRHEGIFVFWSPGVKLLMLVKPLLETL